MHELLRLRGQVGVLRDQLDEAVAREGSQRTQYQIMSGQLDSVKREAAEAMVRAAVSQNSEEKMLAIAQNTLGALAPALNVPEPVSKTSSEKGLRDASLRQYRSYFFFKRACEEMQAAVENQRKARASAE
jgi:hypothetical protein